MKSKSGSQSCKLVDFPFFSIEYSPEHVGMSFGRVSEQTACKGLTSLSEVILVSIVALPIPASKRLTECSI